MSSKIIAKYIRDIGEMYMLYAGIFNLIFGIFGNLLIILVFKTLRVFKKNQSAFYLTVESISNIGLLFVLYLSRILTYILHYDPVSISLSLCKTRSMLIQIFGVCSLLSVCFLSFDQYLSTNLQYYWRQMSTLTLAHSLVVFTVCFAMLHSTIFFIFTENQPSLGCTVYNPIAKNYISFFYYPILTSTLPLIFTITTSLLAYRNVRRIIRRQVPVHRRRLDHQMTAMTLARVLIFVICGLPFIFICLYEFHMDTSETNYMELSIVSLISAILSSLLYSSFMVN
jgi:hypothetical protein